MDESDRFDIDIGDIEGYKSFIKNEPIRTGWSLDRKFYIEHKNGGKMLLRVSDIEHRARKLEEYAFIRRVAAAGVPTSYPISFGECGGGAYVYQLLAWCEGKTAEDVLPRIPVESQYSIGLTAGKMLKKIQTIEEYPPSEKWGVIQNERIDEMICSYLRCGKTNENAALMIDYIENNRHLLNIRPTCISHSDFHIGNLMITESGDVSVIDYERFGIIDPYWGFKSAGFNLIISEPFVAGQIRGYFNGDPLDDFWPIFCMYMAMIAASRLPKVLELQDEFSIKCIESTLRWFENMKNPAANWYKVYE